MAIGRTAVPVPVSRAPRTIRCGTGARPAGKDARVRTAEPAASRGPDQAKAGVCAGGARERKGWAEGRSGQRQARLAGLTGLPKASVTTGV